MPFYLRVDGLDPEDLDDVDPLTDRTFRARNELQDILEQDDV